MNLLALVIAGLGAGWLAGRISRGYGFGVGGDLLAGVLGGVFGGWTFGSAIRPEAGIEPALLFGAALAAALVWIMRGLKVALLVLPLLLLSLPARADVSELRAFPKDMWGSFKEQGRREGLLTLFGAGAGASIARYGSRTYFDDFHVADTLARNRPLGKGAVDFGANLGFPPYLMAATAGTYFAASYLDAAPVKEFGLAGFEALSLVGVQTLILKYSVRRLRPDKTDFAAFPSGHTSAAFALATVAASTWGWKTGVPAFIAASFVGYTRMEGRSHYLSDVFFGAGLGIVSGRAVFHYRKDGHPARYAVAPYFVPGGGGLTMAF